MDGRVLTLLDRAQSMVPVEALPELVMSDPGYWDYLAVYTAIISDPAVLQTVDGEGHPFITNFDVTECLLLSHTQAGTSDTHRWFSILTGCLELLGAGEARWISRSTSLSRLAEDLSVVGAADDLALLAEFVNATPHADDW